ncbi:hypothetical protein NP233_g1175 [Leucocoprinus birnbaumii]|uniref:C2H2-type domain-containing protein n=1 Tax=Leucocoprinus birnbaumii TaxID=56174 RepID=A0AAD5W5W3_9AGAR|nr:hypothetical protein NP233_g1175 [Leucocoprinus birnbaumii]
MPQFLCTSCGQSLRTRKGYISHGRFSKDPDCRRAYQDAIKSAQRHGKACRRVRPKNPHPKPLCSIENTPESQNTGFLGTIPFDGDAFGSAIPFDGDAFGSALEYADESFGQDDGLAAVMSDVPPDDAFANFEDDEMMEEIEQEGEMVAEQEGDWEPLRPPITTVLPPLADTTPSSNLTPEENGVAAPFQPDHDPEENECLQELRTRRDAERVLVSTGHGPEPKRIITYNEQYPASKCGAAFKTSQGRNSDSNHVNPYAPFNSQIDWLVARWAKLRGPGSTALSDLLGIPGVHEALGLSYKSSKELNAIIDVKLPGRPEFHRREVVVGGESFEFYSRDILECIQALWRDPQFENDLIVEPERHYADDDETVRMFHDMHTGKWWWNTQKSVERETRRTGCTIVPVMLSSDKTQLTTFCNKVAYPVYLTIGNLPKHIRRKPSQQAQVLVAYLPTTKLEHITNLTSQRRMMLNMFHSCMKFIVQPLEKAGREGVCMVSGDGLARWCFPILAMYIGDYPEQVLVTLVKTGECPVCPAQREGIGNFSSIQAPHSAEPILDALGKFRDRAQSFVKACADAGIKPVPSLFWKDLPHVDIYSSITPDNLHQLYQGVIKHVLSWIREACGSAKIDTRCRRLPMSHSVRLFMKGVSHLVRVTGTEHDQICRFMLGLIADIQLPNGFSNTRFIKAIRAILDFVYLAKYPVHTSETLQQLDNALSDFHLNAGIFIDLGIRKNFDFPKLHFCGHYHYLIELFGTTDNYNTEYTERLHIDLAKDAYRATNFCDEVPQMTTWLDRKERMLHHERHIERMLNLPNLDSSMTPQLSPAPIPLTGVSLNDIRVKYGAKFFETALCRFVTYYRNPELTTFRQLEDASHDPYSLPNTSPTVVDAIYAKPAYLNKQGHEVPGRFDTAIIDQDKIGTFDNIEGCCIGRIRCILSLPQSAVNSWFPNGWMHTHLAYVEWFTPFSRARVDSKTRMYQVSPVIKNGEAQASVIPFEPIMDEVPRDTSVTITPPSDTYNGDQSKLAASDEPVGADCGDKTTEPTPLSDNSESDSDSSTSESAGSDTSQISEDSTSTTCTKPSEDFGSPPSPAVPHNSDLPLPLPASTATEEPQVDIVPTSAPRWTPTPRSVSSTLATLSTVSEPSIWFGAYSVNLESECSRLLARMYPGLRWILREHGIRLEELESTPSPNGTASNTTTGTSDVMPEAANSPEAEIPPTPPPSPVSSFADLVPLCPGTTLGDVDSPQLKNSQPITFSDPSFKNVFVALSGLDIANRGNLRINATVDNVTIDALD